MVDKYSIWSYKIKYIKKKCKLEHFFLNLIF